MTAATVSTREAAERLERSPRRVRQLAERGALPAIQLTPRGHLRFRLEDVDRLLEPKRKESAC